MFPPHLWHASAPSEHRRLNLATYTPRGVDRLPQASVEWLETLGFPVSRAKEVVWGELARRLMFFLGMFVEACVEDHVQSCGEDEPKGSTISALCDGKAGSKDPNISICVSGVALLAATLKKCFVADASVEPHLSCPTSEPSLEEFAVLRADGSPQLDPVVDSDALFDSAVRLRHVLVAEEKALVKEVACGSGAASTETIAIFAGRCWSWSGLLRCMLLTKREKTLSSGLPRLKLW